MDFPRPHGHFSAARHPVSRQVAALWPRLMLGAALAMMAALPLRAEQCVVIGDSLTKEYEVEFPALFPQNPASWDSRNWIEILHQRRTDWFDTGPFAQNNDPRIVGHEYNWAFPGATAQEIRNQVANPLNFWWTNKLKNHLQNIAERAVVFAGGNDVDSYYGALYNGTATAATTTNVTRENLKWIVDYVRTQKPGLPIVLVSVPHLGCAPDVQLQCPTDAVKTARVTAALDTLNAELAAFAAQRGIGFVPGVYEFTRAMITQPFRIGGLEFYREADMDSRPRYVFSGDGFHPGTAAHGRIAQLVIEAFRVKYPATNITPLTDRSILQDVLGLDPDLPFKEWIATQGVPAQRQGRQDDPDGDGVVNAVEFNLEGFSAGAPQALPRPVRQGGQLTWTYRTRPQAQEWSPAVPQTSTNLSTWTPVPAAQISTQADGTVTVTVPQGAGPAVFLRLGAGGTP